MQLSGAPGLQLSEAEDFLGIWFDMRLLGKLALSVAAILLISWAYKFYSSRGPVTQRNPSGQYNGRVLQQEHSKTAPGTCINCKAELQPRKKHSPQDSETRNVEGTEHQERQNAERLPEGTGNVSFGQNKHFLESSERDTQGEIPHSRPGNTEKTLEAHKYSPVSSLSTIVEHVEHSPEDAENEFNLHGIYDTGKVCSKDTSCTEQWDAALKNKSSTDADIRPEKTLKPLNLSGEELEENAGSCILGACALSLPSSNEPGQMNPGGQRSPCMLRQLEPSAGVGRELRQDLEHPGAFFSFQSKAEITVEDGDLLLERPGDTPIEVRGKIYDYFVESSSQSISDDSAFAIGLSRPIGRRYDDNAQRDSQLIGLSARLARGEDSCGSSHGAEPIRVSRSCVSPLILRDLISQPDSGFPEDSHSSVIGEPPSVSKLGLTWDECHLHSTESADLEISFPRLRTSTPGSSNLGSRTPSSEDLCCSPVIPLYNPMILSKATAGVTLAQMPPERTGSSELESLLGQLDLGNCLQALSLAREHRNTALEEMALKVMSDNYLQVLRDPRLYGRLKADDRDQIQKQRMRGKRYLMVADMYPQDWITAKSAMSESGEPKTSSGLYYYDEYKDTWHARCSLPKEVVSMGCAICTMDNYLFVAVGCQGTDRHITPSRKVFCYNPATDIWKEICPMNEARPLCKLVALQGYIYAIGGECLHTVERYDPRADRWTFVAPLPNDTFAVAHRATACNGELFVSGGTLRYTLLRYNPKTNTWKQSVITGNKERTTEMVAVRNFLYRFDVNPSLGISVYRYHTMARLWYECCSKRLPYCSAFQCTAMDDVIYCINRQFTMRLLADEISPIFIAEDLKVLSTAKGFLFPFVLVLPDKETI